MIYHKVELIETFDKIINSSKNVFVLKIGKSKKNLIII